MLPTLNPGLPEPDPDASLMAEVAGGSQEAFAELICRHQDALLNFFLRMGVYSDAEDLVQETFLRLYRFRARYKPAARFATYLYVLARNVWADRGRKAARGGKLWAALRTEAEISGEAVPAGQMAQMDVQEALERLSPKLREVLVLNIYQGLRYQEIADVLGVPLGTVKSRINLALTALRRDFGEN